MFGFHEQSVSFVDKARKHPLQAALKIPQNRKRLWITTAKGISAGAAIKAIESELDGIFTWKEKQRAALECFLRGEHGFILFPTGFDQ